MIAATSVWGLYWTQVSCTGKRDETQEREIKAKIEVAERFGRKGRLSGLLLYVVFFGWVRCCWGKSDQMTDNPHLTPMRKPEDIDAALRPKSLSEFIGQQAARENLRVFIEAAKSRGDALDHVLFFGPPGLGKTTLAQIVAKELGVGFRSTSGPSSQSRAILRRCSPISKKAMCSSSTKSTG